MGFLDILRGSPKKEVKQIELKGYNSEETSRILPWLGKVKNHFHHAGKKFKGSFGGYCDSCSSPLKKESSYIMESHARCEWCMDKVLYDCDWSYYLKHTDQWLGPLPQELERDANQIVREIAEMRG